MTPQHIYIGSYSNNEPRPCLYDLVTKDLSALKLNIPLVNASYIFAGSQYVYLIEETKNGRLTVINKQYDVVVSTRTMGDSPCHISVNNNFTKLVVTNYGSGSIVMYKLKNNLPIQILSMSMHQGRSTHIYRQTSPHPHCSVFAQNILFVADLGTDFVYFYQVSERETESLKLHKDKSIKLQGTGPRHLTLGQPNKKLLYLSGELDSSITVLSYFSQKLQKIHSYRISNSPSNFPSHIEYHNNMIFMATRGDNYMMVFEQQNTQKKGIVQKFRFKVGEWPRHFKVTGDIIYVACQYANQVQRYRYDGSKIFQLGSLRVSSPSCVA